MFKILLFLFNGYLLFNQIKGTWNCGPAHKFKGFKTTGRWTKGILASDSIKTFDENGELVDYLETCWDKQKKTTKTDKAAIDSTKRKRKRKPVKVEQNSDRELDTKEIIKALDMIEKLVRKVKYFFFILFINVSRLPK